MNKKTFFHLIIHLRLPYQLLLAPIFLWGYFLTGSRPDGDFWLGFLAFHTFLYGGSTAFNSYYDRDEGPVGGLTQPPPVSKDLLPFSLAVQVSGIILAVFVNGTFVVIYLTMFIMGLAYSHPSIRLKGRPLLSVATVTLGQGVLAGLGGWACAEPNLARLDLLGGLGILAAALITTGFYPLTQIYQVEADQARGDTTFAAWAGPRGSFIFAIVAQGLAAVLLVSVIASLLGVLKAAVVALFYGLLLVTTTYWAYTFDGSRVYENHRRIMGLNTLTSLGFLAFIGLHLFGFL